MFEGWENNKMFTDHNCTEYGKSVAILKKNKNCKETFAMIQNESEWIFSSYEEKIWIRETNNHSQNAI